jgi:hypothetical protein
MAKLDKMIAPLIVGVVLALAVAGCGTAAVGARWSGDGEHKPAA